MSCMYCLWDHKTDHRSHLGDVEVQTLDQLIPALGEGVQSGLQFVGHVFVLDAGQEILAHGAEPVHGRMLRLQLRFQHLMDQSHRSVNESECRPDEWGWRLTVRR